MCCSLARHDGLSPRCKPRLKDETARLPLLSRAKRWIRVWFSLLLLFLDTTPFLLFIVVLPFFLVTPRVLADFFAPTRWPSGLTWNLAHVFWIMLQASFTNRQIAELEEKYLGESRWLTSAYWFGLFFSSGLILVL